MLLYSLLNACRLIIIIIPGSTEPSSESIFAIPLPTSIGG